jgi:soluble lytic murein transglycosylase-like protein
MCPTLPVILTIIMSVCAEHKLPCEMFQAVAYVESRYNPNAVSYTKDKGLFQISSITANHYGLKDPFNSEENATVAAKHLVYLKRKFKNWDTAIMSYNWGSAKVVRADGTYPDPVVSYLSKVKRKMFRLIREYRKKPFQPLEKLVPVRVVY